MSKSLKSIFAAVLAVLMVLGMASCAKTPASSTAPTPSNTDTSSAASEAPKNAYAENGTVPLTKEDVTLKILTLYSTASVTGKTGTQKIWKWMEEQTGIKAEIEEYDAENMKTKLPLILSGNNLPDVFLRVNFTSGDLINYAINKKIIALDDYIQDYGYYTKQILEKYDYAKGALTASDGHVYGLAQFSNSPWKVFGPSINTDWLKKVGKEKPTTLEELYEVLKAFKEQDANGNGDPNDEIPLSSANLAAMSPQNEFMGFVGLAEFWPVSGTTYDDKDGKVFMTRVSDNYRYLLSWFHKCYKEGLMDPEIFSQTGDQYTEKMTANRVGVNCDNANFVSEKYATEYGIHGDYLVLGTEKFGDPVCGFGMPFNPNLYTISATCKNPELAFMYGDFMYSEEASWLTNKGEEGVDFEWTDKDRFRTKSLDNGNSWYVLNNSWARDEWASIILPTDYNAEIKQEFDDKLTKYKKNTFQNYLAFTQEETDQISMLSTDMATVIDEAFVKFITGEGKDIDSDADWNAYVKQVTDLGLDDLTKVYQAAYDRFYGKG